MSWELGLAAGSGYYWATHNLIYAQGDGWITWHEKLSILFGTYIGRWLSRADYVFPLYSASGPKSPFTYLHN